MLRERIVVRGERIYHLPGSRNYDRVTVTGADERWFCSEAEASAAEVEAGGTMR